MKKSLGLLLLLVLNWSLVCAQSGWETDAVRSINPQYPTNDLWKGISATAKPLAIAVPLSMSIAALIKNDRPLKERALQTAGSVLLAVAATGALKVIVNRPRPYQSHTGIYPDSYEDGRSFPSAHVSMTFATATSISLQCRKWYITVPAFAWCSAVAYSRMYLGQHYPSDVIFGAITGAGSAYLSHWLTKKIITKNKK